MQLSRKKGGWRVLKSGGEKAGVLSELKQLLRKQEWGWVSLGMDRGQTEGFESYISYL